MPKLFRRLWPNRLWPSLSDRLWTKPTLANVNVLVVCKDDFWELIVQVFFCVLSCRGWSVGVGVDGVGRKGGVGGGGPKGWAQNFALLFPSPAVKFVLFFPLWGSSRGILVVFEAPGRSVCTFGVLWLSCEAPLAPKPPESPNVHISRSMPSKFNGRNHKREKKE